MRQSHKQIQSRGQRQTQRQSKQQRQRQCQRRTKRQRRRYRSRRSAQLVLRSVAPQASEELPRKQILRGLLRLLLLLVRHLPTFRDRRIDVNRATERQRDRECVIWAHGIIARPYATHRLRFGHDLRACSLSVLSRTINTYPLLHLFLQET